MRRDTITEIDRASVILLCSPSPYKEMPITGDVLSWMLHERLDSRSFWSLEGLTEGLTHRT